DAPDVAADGGGCPLVPPVRFHRGPPHRSIEPHPDPEPDQPDDQRDVVEDPLARGLRGEEAAARAGRLQREAERAARPVALGDDEQPDDLAHRQRHEAEIMTDDPEARARIRHDQGEGRRRRHRHERAEPGRQAIEVPEQRRRVGADAEKRAVAERDEAEAAHQRPGPTDERPDEDLDDHVEHVLPHAAHGNEGRSHQTEQNRGGHGAADHRSRRARMPPGRMNIITMKSANAITYPISVDQRTPPSEMISLITNDAMKAPSMLPRPPSTQTMNVIGPKAAPKYGCTEYWMESSAAASPAIAPPTAEVTR